MTQILAFGDSITDGAFDVQGGWATRLQSYYMAENLKKDVVRAELDWVYNLGVSADTTTQLLERVEREAVARKVNRPDKKSILLYAIGANDSMAEGTQDGYRFTVAAFSANLQRLADIAKTYTSKVIFIGIIPVIESQTTPIYDDCWYTNERIKIFDEAVKVAAQKNDAEYIELFDEMTKLPNLENYFSDGLHPNGLGHEWMFSKIQPVVEKVLVK